MHLNMNKNVEFEHSYDQSNGYMIDVTFNNIGFCSQIHSGAINEYALEEIMPAVPDLIEPTDQELDEITIDMT